VVASLGGAPRNPTWYHNLRKNPYVQLQDRASKRDYMAREVTGKEKATSWRLAATTRTPPTAAAGGVQSAQGNG
jgi:deazaflavin-dependent oxidoreductase (nitroreductase family)